MIPLCIFLIVSVAIAAFSYFQYKALAKQFAQNWLAGKKTLKREYVSCCISHKTYNSEHETEQVVSLLRRHKYVIYRSAETYVAHTPSNLYRRPFMVKVITLQDGINVQIKDGVFHNCMGKAGVDIYKKLMLKLCYEIAKLISSTDGNDVDIVVQIGPLSKWEKNNGRGSFFKDHINDKGTTSSSTLLGQRLFFKIESDSQAGHE